MKYGFRCPIHGAFEAEYPTGKAPVWIKCRYSLRRCFHRATRVFDAVVHFGPGFSPYGDRVQHSKELSRHFGGKD